MMAFTADIFTLYPEMFPGPLGHSLAGEALKQGIWAFNLTQIRDYGMGRHRAVDDTPAGGGAGMVLRADVLGNAFDAIIAADDPRPRYYLSPRGRPLIQAEVRALAEAAAARTSALTSDFQPASAGVILLCGRFEGVDERFLEHYKFEEISIGDYILSGGELAAMVLLDAIIRLLPGVMGKELSGETESFENGLLEHPHYTRPREIFGESIPEVLLSGNHAKIEAWRNAQSLALTKARRPDLFQTYQEGGKGVVKAKKKDSL